MNIKTIVAALSDADLKDAIRGLKAFDETGGPGAGEGVFRRVVEELELGGKVGASDAVGFARYALLRAAAYRWAGVENEA